MSREALQIGSEIDRYLIKDILSEDGRGISYLAIDTGSVSGSSKVLVREYFPRGISLRESGNIEPRDRNEAREEFGIGLAGFVGAGRDLIKLKTHTLVPALDLIQVNGSAYLVLEWPEGQAFSTLVETGNPMSAEWLRSQLTILLSGLSELHGAGLLHAGISPETLIRLDDGYPAISHLTHVERFDGADINRTHLLLDTPYAAPELNSRSSALTGPWTDIYSLSATCWFLLTGEAPPSAAARLASIATGRGDLLDIDDIENLGDDYYSLGQALMNGLELMPEKRFESAAAFTDALTRKRMTMPAFFTAPAAIGGGIAASVAALAFAAFMIAPGQNRDQVETAEVETSEPEITIQWIHEQTAAAVAEQAEAGLNDPLIEWAMIDQDDRAAIRSFLASHGDHPDVFAKASARLKSLDTLAWEAAKVEGTQDSIEQYLVDFSAEMLPPGQHIDAAKQALIELSGQHEFEIAETRRLLFALGYKTNTRRGLTPGLTRAVLGFQESISVDTTGEINGELLEQMSAEVKRRDEEAAAVAEAKRLAEETKAANERFVKLVQQAATSTSRTASGTINRPELPTEKTTETIKSIVPPKAKPKVIYETKIASSRVSSGTITSEEIPAEPKRESGETFRDCDECPQLTVIPAGSFQMGSPKAERGRSDDEGPVHGVRISKPFAMGKFEITLGQYETFVHATGRKLPLGCAAESARKGGSWQVKSHLNFRTPGFSQTPVNPVTCVSWNDAKAYTKWLSKKTGKTYRLATETEWEYAARAGSQKTRHFGNTYRDGCKFANGADRSAGIKREHWVTAKCKDGYETTSPVGSFRANAFGLHDMIGNVWEWTEDCYASSYKNTPRTEASYKTSTCRSRVTRGGSWAADAALLRSASRSADASTARYDMLGFRVVRELPQQ